MTSFMHLYLRRLTLLYKTLKADFGSRDYYAYLDHLKNELGNLSYDSGLPL